MIFSIQQEEEGGASEPHPRDTEEGDALSLEQDGDEDNELMIRVGQKDGAALAILMRKYKPLLKTVVRQICVSDANIEDIIQEVWITVLKHPHFFDPKKAKLIRWLVTICKRRTIDMLRKDISYANALGRFEKSFKADPLHKFSEGHPSDGDEKEMLWQIIETLPPGQKDAVRLFMLGKSQQQSATELKIPLGTLYNRLRLGIDKIRKALAALDFKELTLRIKTDAKLC